MPPTADVTGKYFEADRDAFAKHGFTQTEALTLDELGNVPRLNAAFDFIYLTGGNPIVFLDNALRAGLLVRLREFLDRGGVVIGASGGAMLLTRSVALFRLEGGTVADALASQYGLAGLALVDQEILPHAHRFTGAQLAELGEYARQVGHDVLALDDGAAVIYTSATEYRSLGKVTRHPAASSR